MEVSFYMAIINIEKCATTKVISFLGRLFSSSSRGSTTLIKGNTSLNRHVLIQGQNWF